MSFSISFTDRAKRSPSKIKAAKTKENVNKEVLRLIEEGEVPVLLKEEFLGVNLKNRERTLRLEYLMRNLKITDNNNNKESLAEIGEATRNLAYRLSLAGHNKRMSGDEGATEKMQKSGTTLPTEDCSYPLLNEGRDGCPFMVKQVYF